MTFEALVNLFKDSVNAYTGSLEFVYDKVWYNNGQAANNYPSCLFECSPDFELRGYQSNNRTGQQIFQGKLFFYDTFWQGERQLKDAYVKQSELNELALQVIGEVKRRSDAVPMQIEWGKGFFGIDVHNPKLVQVYVPFTAYVRSECTPLPV